MTRQQQKAQICCVCLALACKDPSKERRGGRGQANRATEASADMPHASCMPACLATGELTAWRYGYGAFFFFFFECCQVG